MSPTSQGPTVVSAARLATVTAAYRVAPAAKRFHQAYAHGLLEHCLTVAQAVAAMAGTFPGIDRDVAETHFGIPRRPADVTGD